MDACADTIRETPFERFPVLITAFNRPDELRRLIDTLRSYYPTKLYIAIDGARLSNPGEEKRVASCIDIARSLKWPAPVHLLVQERNLGCGVAVPAALAWFFEQEPEGIVLEDDINPTSAFFTFAEKALERFRDNPEVFLAAGCNFVPWASEQVEGPWRRTRYPRVWGWVSWADRWEHYAREMPSFLSIPRIWRLWRWTKGSLSETLYWLRHFHRVRSGRLDTWDYQLIAHSVEEGCEFVTANRNLVHNTGWGSDATHTRLAPGFLLPAQSVVPGDWAWNSDALPNESADSWERSHVFQASGVRLVRKALTLIGAKASLLT